LIDSSKSVNKFLHHLYTVVAQLPQMPLVNCQHVELINEVLESFVHCKTNLTGTWT